MFLYKPNIFRSYNIVSGTTDNNLSFVESNFSEEILKLTKLLQIKPNSIHRLTQVHGNDYLFLEESTNLEQIKQSGDAIKSKILVNFITCLVHKFDILMIYQFYNLYVYIKSSSICL
jgi:copper oxidase (laccase) domain-containing protein